MHYRFKWCFADFQNINLFTPQQQQSVGSPKARPQRFCTWAGASRPQGLQAEGHPWERRLWKGRLALGFEEGDNTSLGLLGRKNHNWGHLCYQGDRKRGNKQLIVPNQLCDKLDFRLLRQFIRLLLRTTTFPSLCLKEMFCPWGVKKANAGLFPNSETTLNSVSVVFLPRNT